MQLSKEQEANFAIIKKCWEDETFKQKLITNPKKTIEEFGGESINLPTGVKMIVNDQTDTSFLHFNIPPMPNVEDFELNEVQLETIAGGTLTPEQVQIMELLKSFRRLR